MTRHKPASRGSLPNGIPAHIALARCAPAPAMVATPAAPPKAKYSRRLFRVCVAILALYGALILIGSM